MWEKNAVEYDVPVVMTVNRKICYITQIHGRKHHRIVDDKAPALLSIWQRLISAYIFQPPGFKFEGYVLILNII